MTCAEYGRLSYEEKLLFSPDEYRRMVEADHSLLCKEQAHMGSLRYLLPCFLKEMAPVFVPGLAVIAVLLVLL
jgi:hypothetical protein